jgi:hypothetical protein
MKRQVATAWWLLAVQGLLLVVCSGLLLLVFRQVSVADLARQIAAAGPSEAPFLLSPARYSLLGTGLRGGLVVGLLLAGLASKQGLGPPKARVSGQGQQWRNAMQRRWSLGALTPGQARLAGLLLVGVTGLHGWFAFYDPLSLDEAISYAWFIHPGPAVAASYYPFPNNHVLLSVLGAGLHQVAPTASPLVILRVVPALAGLLVLGVSYRLLLSGLRFGTATLAWLFLNLSPALLGASVAGRGYGLVLLALLSGLLASGQLLRPRGLRRGERRVAWLVFGCSGVVGLYTVPTHLYGLLGLLGGLSIGFTRLGGRRARLNLLHLAIVTGGMGVVVALLYLPIITVTSWDALVHNTYVQPVARVALWRELAGDYFPAVAGGLLGWPWVSGALFVAVAVATPLLLRWGHLPEPTRRLGWLAYIQLVSWLGFMQVQQVLPPPRTLLAVLFCFVLLALLGCQWLVARWRGARLLTTYGFQLSLLLVSAAGAYRLGHYVVATAQPRRQSLASFERVYKWLQLQHPRAVWVDQLPLAVYLRYEALRMQQEPLLVKLVPELPAVARTTPTDYLLVLNPAADQRAVYRVGAVALVAGAKGPATFRGPQPANTGVGGARSAHE